MTYTYNDYNKVLSIVDTHGPDIYNEYEDAGNVSRLIKRTTKDGNLANDQVEEFTPDDRDRIVSYEDASGRVTTTLYDTIGVGCNVQDVPREVTDAASRTTKMFYDKRNRLTKSIDPRGGVTLFEYNLRGERIAITDPEGTRTKFRFDGNGRMIRRERPTVRTVNGKAMTHIEVTNYVYNQDDLLLRKEIELPHYSNGTSMGHLVQDFQYDGHNRLIHRRQFKESPFRDIVELYEDATFTYENQLDSTLMITANNTVMNLGFGYEAIPPFALTSYSTTAVQTDNPLNLIEGNFTVTPAAQNPIGIVTKNGDQLLARSYDPAGRLTNVNATFAGNTLNTAIGHDGFGRKSTVTHSNGLEGVMTYDKLNRTTNITWTGAGENFSEAISYGAETGNIDQIEREFGIFNYTHDQTDQLTSVAYTGTIQLPSELVNRTFSSDYAGNRASDTANGITKSHSNIILENDKFKILPDEDGLGRIWQKVYKQENKVDIFGYETDGKLVHFKRYENNVLTRDVRYYHDALNRRVAKKFTINNQLWTNTFAYLGFNWQILFSQNGQGDRELFTDALGIDEHLGKINSGGAFAFTTDYLGTVTNDEAVGEKKVTSPWGEPLGQDLVLNTSSAPVRYGFTGRPVEVESGCQDNRWRIYCADISAFTTEDPKGIGGGHPNLVLYSLNNPLQYIDPLGLYFEYSNIGSQLTGEAAGQSATGESALAYIVAATSPEPVYVSSQPVGSLNDVALQSGIPYEVSGLAGGNSSYQEIILSSGLSPYSMTDQALFLHEVGHVVEIQAGVNSYEAWPNQLQYESGGMCR